MSMRNLCGYLGDFLERVSILGRPRSKGAPTFMYVTISTHTQTSVSDRHDGVMNDRTSYHRSAPPARRAARGRSCCGALSISSHPTPSGDELTFRATMRVYSQHIACHRAVAEGRPSAGWVAGACWSRGRTYLARHLDLAGRKVSENVYGCSFGSNGVLRHLSRWF